MWFHLESHLLPHTQHLWTTTLLVGHSLQPEFVDVRGMIEAAPELLLQLREAIFPYFA